MTPVKVRSGSAGEDGNHRKGENMRHFPTLAAAAIIAASALSSVPGMADETSDISAIEDIWQTYSASFAAGDAETWLSLWDEDGIQMPPGADARSFDILQAAVPDAFQESDVSAMHIYPEETTVTGDWAFSRGTYDIDETVDGEPAHFEGKFMTILRRQDGGSWKIYRDIFNASGP